MAQILIIDDEPRVCDMLSDLIQELGHTPYNAYTLENGHRQITEHEIDVVLLDIHLPDGNGLEAIPILKKGRNSPEVIIITGYGDPDGAELAINSGAWYYIQKKDSIQKIILSLKRVLDYRNSVNQSQSTTKRFKRCGIIGQSQPLKQCIEKTAQAADTDANVLISGETGTGKELFAYALHANSRRADNHFVVVDCAALPESLVESTLFGHKKGAFTGADKQREGLISQADGGTLFLDEIGEMTLSLQKILLRVLQEKRYRPIGGTKEVKSDFRLVSATNRNLDQMVKEKRFRKDLLYRLRTMDVELPPLCKRKPDIKAITGKYVDEIVGHNGLKPKGIDPDVIEMLCAYDWPGNVRELIAILENAVIKAKNESILFPQHLPTSLRAEIARSDVLPKEAPCVAISEDSAITEPTEPVSQVTGPSFILTYKDYCREYKVSRDGIYFRKLMELADHDIETACRISGLSRTQIYTHLKKNHIPRRRYNRS